MTSSRPPLWKRIIEFLCCFSFGFFAYMALEYFFRGYSYVLMVICGGIGFWCIGQINEDRQTSLVSQGVLGSCLITMMELVVGLVLLSHGVRMWDYTGQPGNFMGVICPLFSLLWFALSIIIVFVDDWLRHVLFGDAWHKYNLF